MNRYIINSKTLALLEIDDLTTKIYEVDNSFLVHLKLADILEESCLYYGSSFKGRRMATQYLVGVSYRQPIMVREKDCLIFFPTSNLNENKLWISYQLVEDYYVKKKLLVITFKNGFNLNIELSYAVMNSQMRRSFRLESAIKTVKNI